MTYQETNPMTRAYRAYFRAHGPKAQQPGGSSSSVQKHDEREYAVLRNCNGILAVYLVQANGSLRCLKKWPEALEDW